ncbi:unnamed protein product, partial [Rotaria socialis]
MSQPTTTILRLNVMAVSTSPTVASISTAIPSASTAAPKDFSVRVPNRKTRAQYGIMEFASGVSVDVKDWKAIEMRREINPY